MGQKYVPELHLEVGVTSAQDSHKVGFLGVDGPFGCVSLVGVGRSQLVIESLVVKKGKECTGYLVVEAL